MIQMGTVLQVADNTGAKKIACIKMLGGSTAGQYARKRPAAATVRTSSSTTTRQCSSTTRASRSARVSSVR
jgi:ribosomal protein L14